jgi:hypothetical protein
MSGVVLQYFSRYYSKPAGGLIDNILHSETGGLESVIPTTTTISILGFGTS